MLWWICPECGEKVEFEKQVKTLFDETGEANFSTKQGFRLHTIRCNCGCIWAMSLTGVITEDDD